MPSLKDLKSRISSVRATKKITRAMQMVAAAKLRRAQEAAESARPYAQRMDLMIANLAHGLMEGEQAPRLLTGSGGDDTHLLVVVTADRGLCGTFNGNIAKYARDRASGLIAQGKSVKFICVGRKGHDVLKRLFPGQIVKLFECRARQGGFPLAHDIGRYILEMFKDGHFDVCTLFHAHFESVVSQKPTALQLIPARMRENGRELDNAENWVDANRGGAVCEYEPEQSEILEELLPRNIPVQIFRAMLENAAGEQGARMSAMDSATRNAGDMIDRLTLRYNSTRQAMITSELIEIISGAESL
ncbi:MAG: F0F1 ATP synthase subunit gamma [Hyphomicrobiales bacterium]